MDKVQQGQKLKIAADAYNAFVDAAQWTKKQSQGGKNKRSGNALDSATRAVCKNVAGQTLQQYYACVLKDTVVDPNDSEDGFTSGICFETDIPADGYSGQWGVPQEHIASNTYGEVVYHGLTIAWINVINAGDLYVDLQAGSLMAVSADKGYGQIVWVDGGAGAASDTGEQWAVIRLGFGGLGQGQYQYQCYMMVSQNQAGWDYIRAHPLT